MRTYETEDNTIGIQFSHSETGEENIGFEECLKYDEFVLEMFDVTEEDNEGNIDAYALSLEEVVALHGLLSKVIAKHNETEGEQNEDL